LTFFHPQRITIVAKSTPNRFLATPTMILRQSCPRVLANLHESSFPLFGSVEKRLQDMEDNMFENGGHDGQSNHSSGAPGQQRALITHPFDDPDWLTLDPTTLDPGTAMLHSRLTVMVRQMHGIAITVARIAAIENNEFKHSGENIVDDAGQHDIVSSGWPTLIINIFDDPEWLSVDPAILSPGEIAIASRMTAMGRQLNGMVSAVADLKATVKVNNGDGD
jgi:hypothetical protein